MKRIVAAILAVVMMVSLASCSFGEKKVIENLGEIGPELMSNYSFDSSLQIFCFDGQKTSCRTIFDSAVIGEIATKINSLENKYEDPSVLRTEWVEPAYGISICSTYGETINLSYSNGLWVSQEGDVFRADSIDLQKFFDLAEPDYEEESGLKFPNSIYICEYCTNYYGTSEDFNFVDGAKLKITNSDSGSLDMTLTNNTGGNLPYGGSFKLQRKVDGNWVFVPTSSDVVLNLAGGGPSLLDGESVVLSAQYSYNYDYLVDGNYRVLLYRENHGFEEPFVAAEFKVK